LHFELSQKTAIKDPPAMDRENSQRTNDYPIFRLEELKMSGKIGYKLALDAAAFVTSKEFQDVNAGVEVRRARVYAKGDCLLLLPVSYEFEIGYVPGSFYIENSYLQFHELGFLDFLGSSKVGQYQVPMSLVNYGSSRDMMFMESAAAVQALAPGVNAGVQVGQPVFKERMTWALGLFTDAAGEGSDFGEATKGFGRVVGRLTGLPVFSRDPDHPESHRLLHLGLSGSAVYAGEHTVRYRSRPESHLAPYVVDTGEIEADGAFTVGAEAAWVHGPLCVQGEFLHSWFPDNTGQDVSFGGFYASASWFLTGESRSYDRTQGTFGRVVPKRNFNFGNGGWGAWEIAGRYSYANLDGGDVQGGRLWMLMAGVNWYLHSHLKWRFEYGFGHVADSQPAGNLNVIQTRMEVDF
jgi:phosphate-selective porin OprO/OprP